MALDKLHFQVAFGAIRHFGRNLYSTNPPAIAELVANAWDAYAKQCFIFINADSMLIVDNGIGMTDEEFQERYAKSGNEKNTLVRIPNDMRERPYMGKKGIGKFSAFSLADEYELYTKSDEDEKWKHIKLEQGLLHTMEATLEIPIVQVETLDELQQLFGYDLSKISTGTIIYLPKLKRMANTKTLNSLIKLLSHRFSITTIMEDGKFDVSIFYNKEETKLDFAKHFYYDDIEYLHYFGYTEEKIKEMFPKLDDKHLIQEESYDKDVKGWIGSVELPSSLVIEDTIALKGVCVYINGKLVDEDIVKSIKKDRMSDTYIVGEVDANYLGVLSEDVVLSSREGLFLDNDEVGALKSYLEMIRKNLVSNWDAMRRDRPLEKQEYLQALIENPINKKYYDNLEAPAKKRFNKYAQKLFDRPKNDCDSSIDKLHNLLFSALLQIVNNESLQDLIKQDKSNEDLILECFDKIFGLVEINHALRLRDSVRNNLHVIKELEKFIETGEVEKVFEKHLEKNPWIIEPTWIAKAKSVHSQNYYSILGINNSEEKLYVDLIVEVSDELYPVIIELKREKATTYSTPNANEISAQIYNYKKALSTALSKELGKEVYADSIKSYFICGKKAFDQLDQNDRNKLEREGIQIRSYDELIRVSKRIFEVNFGEDLE